MNPHVASPEVVKVKLDILRNYLTAMVVERSRCQVGPWSNSPDLAQWLLEHGREFSWNPQKSDRKLNLGRDGECYSRSQYQAVWQPRLRYVEGVASSNDLALPINHAWCVESSGRVVDPTWSQRSGNRRYFGVVFRTEYVEQFLRERKTNQAILLWDEQGWPVQTGRHSEILWQDSAFLSPTPCPKPSPNPTPVTK